jgi:Mn2+/Fe2+ NRAMP family transporter
MDGPHYSPNDVRRRLLSAKLGRLSGRGLFQAIRDYYPRAHATLISHWSLAADLHSAAL